MVEIEVSESQVEELEALRAELESEYVGEYGYVRVEDVVQFLLDEQSERHERMRQAAEAALDAFLEARSYQDLQRFASETEGVEPAGTADELRGRLVDAYVSDALDGDGPPHHAKTGESDETAADATTASASAPGTVDDSTGAAAETGDGTAAESADEEDAASEDEASGGGGESRLDRMMGLLDEYDEKWGETESDQGKYEVVLPDGRTEAVRTKDDVRALLFKHY